MDGRNSRQQLRQNHLTAQLQLDHITLKQIIVFHSDAVINQLLLNNSIKPGDIKYQIKASTSKPPELFKDFVHSVADTCNK